MIYCTYTHTYTHARTHAHTHARTHTHTEKQLQTNIFPYMKMLTSCSQPLTGLVYNFVSYSLLMNIGWRNSVIIHELSFVSILHDTSYSLFLVACWDNARRDVAFMSLGVITESVTSSLVSNFSVDRIMPRQITHFSHVLITEVMHRSNKKVLLINILYLHIFTYIW